MTPEPIDISDADVAFLVNLFKLFRQGPIGHLSSEQTAAAFQAAVFVLATVITKETPASAEALSARAAQFVAIYHTTLRERDKELDS